VVRLMTCTLRLVLAAVIVSVWPSSVSAQIDWTSRVGRVARDEIAGTLCVVTRRGVVREGQTVWLVSSSAGSQVLVRAVTGVRSGCADYLQNDLEEVFPLQLGDGAVPPLVPSIAIWGLDTRPAVRGAAVLADVDGDGTEESFGFCTSMEGVHLTVWTGGVATGVRRWHKYHPLSYDVEPSCTDEEMNEPYS